MRERSRAFRKKRILARERTWGALVVGLLLVCASQRTARAQPSALEHFQRGYEAAQTGELELAIQEFELAYAQSPHFSVLYNLGQAYVSAGRAVEAVDTLQRYLELAGAGITEQRRGQVQALIRYHSHRIGALELDVQPAGAELSLDGKRLGSAPLPKPVRVVAGLHGLAASAPGYATSLTSIRISGQKVERVRLELTPLQGQSELRVLCGVPDVELTLDGRAVGRTPFRKALALDAGAHEVTFRRAGYVASPRRIVVPAGQAATLRCEVRPERDETRFARLAVTHPVGTRVRLDDAPFRGKSLPAGRHTLAASGPGYETAERSIVLEPRRSHHFMLSPHPSNERLFAARQERAWQERRLAYILGGVGLASGTAAGILYVVNNRRHDQWEEDSQKAVKEGSVDKNTINGLLEDEKAIRTRDTIALGLGVFAVSALAAATYFFLQAESSRVRMTLTAKRAPGFDLRATW
jgi:hypothetical protein